MYYVKIICIYDTEWNDVCIGLHNITLHVDVQTVSSAYFYNVSGVKNIGCTNKCKYILSN